MNFDEQIHDLLATNNKSNDLLALQLLQGQFEGDWTATFLYLFDYYWKEQSFELTLVLGPIELSYRLTYTDDGGLMEVIWVDIDLEFRMRNSNTVIGNKILASDDMSIEEDSKYLDDYKELIRTHFEQQIPIILEQLNY